MKKYIQKPLAMILSFSLLMGCFTGLPFVASATDGESVKTADEDTLFTFTDFEDGSSPFAYNGKAGASTGEFYTYNGNTALLLNDGPNNKLTQRLPEGTLEGATMAMDAAKGGIQGYAYAAGNEGYRPTKVSFRFKPVGRASNGHVLFAPLTFSGQHSGNPLDKVISFNMIIQAGNRRVAWSADYTGLITPVNAGSKTVFTGIKDAVRETKVFTFADKNLDTAGTESANAANAELIETIRWYDMEVNYSWDDTNNQVTIDAAMTDGTSSIHNSYTITYDPALISEVYNFGMIAVADQNPIFIDEFAYYSENPATHEVVGPHTAFLKKHQAVIETAADFDITADYAGKTSEEREALKNGADAFLTEYATQKDVVKNYVDVQNAYTNVTAMKNAILDYSAASVLEDFKAEYADILGIVKDDLTVAPKDLAAEGLIDRTAAAITAFNAIDEDLRNSSEGVVIGNKLNRLNQCLGYQSIATGDGVYTQNFEGSNDFKAYAEYDGYKENQIGPVNDFDKNGVIAKDTNNTTAYGVQTVVPNNFGSASASHYGQFVTADQTLYDVMKNNGKYLSSGSFDMYLLPYHNATKQQMIVYGYKDLENYRFFGMFGQKTSSAPATISVSMRDYEVKDLNGTASELVDGRNIQRRATGFHSAEDFSRKWYHFDFMYDSQGRFHLVITDENGRVWSYDSERTVSVSLEERILAFGVMGQNDKYYIDNVTMKFTENGEDAQVDESVAFFMKQSVRETTELVVDKIVPYDFARIDRFVNDYNALSEENKALMPRVGEFVSKFQEQMSLWDTASDKKVAESFVKIYGDRLAESAVLSVFNRLTVSQRNIIKTDYADQYNAMMSAAKSSAADATIDITCVGDSITAGSGATTIATDSYPAQLATKLGEGYKTYNHGIPGIKVLQSSSAADTASTDGQFRGTEQNYIGYYSSIATNPDIVIIMLGTNDVVVDSKNFQCTDAKRAQIKAGYTDLVQSYLALDCNPTVILAKIPANNYPENDSKNRYYTTRAKSQVLSEIYDEVAAEYGLSVIDIGGYTWPWTDEEKAEYFASDNLHPSTAGYDKISGFFADYIKAGTCISNTASACMYDFTAMDFVSVQPKVTDSIALTYKATIGAALMKSSPVIKPVMTFEMNGKVSEPVEGTLVEGTTDSYTFTYPEIMAQNMADKITATLKVGSASKTYEYSVMDYCQNILGRDAIEGYSQDQLASLKEMIVDLVQYGAAVQTYRKAPDTLSGYLTSEQLAFDKNHGELTDLSPITERLTAGESTAYKWTGVSLVLKDKVNIRCKFTADDITGLGVKVRVGGQEVECDAKFVEAGTAGVYYLDFDGIYAYEYADKIEIALIDKDGVTGQVLNYSVDTYLYNMREYSDANLVSLLKEINDYGNAAAFYKQLADSTME